MICPNCDIFYENDCRFCGRCGAVLIPDAPVKKGSHWIPILIMVLLSILGIGVFFATQGIAAPETPWFDVRENTLYFDDSRYSGSSEVTVPGSVNNQKILHIGRNCFADCDELTTVILPEGLESIGQYAFSGCDRLRGIYIPGTVSIIESCAFADCDKLEAIFIPGSITFLAPDSFDNCPSLKHVFFAGTYGQWLLLTGDDLGLDVSIYCSDGNYCQGIPIP